VKIAIVAANIEASGRKKIWRKLLLTVVMGQCLCLLELEFCFGSKQLWLL
jgi:hypothetical protein